jgi:hypothetical protein
MVVRQEKLVIMFTMNIIKKMATEKIWLALVGVKPLKGNEILPKVKGAYVNVACISTNEENFKNDLAEIFNQYRFALTDIDEIETEDNMVIANPKNAEKLQLLSEIKEGYKFAWGAFHTF